jgi:hypothetical protein
VGRPSKLSPHAPRRFGDEGVKLLESLQYLGDDEDAAVRQLRLQLMVGKLHECLDAPPIKQYRFEYPLPGTGLADLVVVHEDGGVSIVEVKGPRTVRDIAAGIGQLFLYEGAMWQEKFGGRTPAYVKKVLCAPVWPTIPSPIYEACLCAGVQFLPAAPSEFVRRIAKERMHG